MKFHEGRMRTFTEEHIGILEKILNHNGDCTNKEIKCHKCPFNSSNNRFDSECGSRLYGTITKDDTDISIEVINKRRAQIISDILRQQDKDYRIKELEKRVEELECDVKKLKRTPLEMALEDISINKFTYVKPQDEVGKYRISYYVPDREWRLYDSDRYIVAGSNLFTRHDAAFLTDILNKYKITIENINEILGGIKYE